MKVAKFALAYSALLNVAAAAAEPATPIRLNQVGLIPDASHRAMLSDPSKEPLEWELVDAGNKVVTTGRTQLFGADRFSGEHVHRITFAASASGNYRLRAGDRSSRWFRVAADTYARLPHDALAFFYHQRSGTPIEARFVGDRWARPAGHPREVATCVSGADGNGNRWPGCNSSPNVTGGWYDAGDHGKYVVNGGISLWTLLNLYEVQNARSASIFTDKSARIPEAGNGVSDLLDEARYELEFFLKMQVPEGTRQRLPIGEKRNRPGLTFTEIDTSGMVHHKVGDERWTGIPMRPDKDPERRMLFPPSTSATLNFAATTAQCARIWREIDSAFAAACLSAARRAWAAAMRNPEIYAIADFTGSGGYGDQELNDEFYWAAAELFVTTGDAEYRRALSASPHFSAAIQEAPGWPSVATLGTVSLALHPDAIGEVDATRLRRKIAGAAARYVSEAEQTGYHVPFTGRWGWGSTAVLLNRAMLIALAYDLTGEAKYRDGVVDVMDFILGRNPLDVSFVSGYGARPMQNPHHRFWAHSMDANYPPPPPGALSGGPNQNTSQDDVAKTLKGCAPQTCWADDIRAYSLNEVAINWNAPLVWVSAWLADSRSKDASGERGR